MRLTHRVIGNPLTFFSCILVLSVALALLSTLVLFTDLLVFHPIRLAAGDRVVRLGGLSKPLLIDDVEYWRQTKSLELLALGQTGSTEVSIDGQRRLRSITVASKDYFSVLEADPIRGRIFAKWDFESGGDAAAVISNRFWKDTFGSNPDVIGSVLRISGLDCRVVGVMSEKFIDPAGTDIWLPRTPFVLAQVKADGRIDRSWLGRIRADATLAQVRQEVRSLLVRLNETYTRKTGVRYGTITVVEPLRVAMGRPYRVPMIALLVGGGLVLLLAWANITTIMLSRAIGRRHEFAIRISIGATPLHIVRMFVVEAAALGTMSALTGSAAAAWLSYVSRPLFASSVPALARSSDLPYSAWGVAAGSACILTIVSAMAPLLMSSLRKEWFSVAGSLSGAPLRARRIRESLLVGQMALAMVLTTAAYMAGRTYLHLSAIDLGFNPSGLMVVKVAYPHRQGLDPTAWTSTLFSELIGTRGVLSAGAINAFPFADEQVFLSVRHGSVSTMAMTFVVQGDYFQAMGIAVRRGRTFGLNERAAVIVSAPFAKELWHSENVVGRVIVIEGESGPRQIVGVVGDVRSSSQEGDAGLRYQMYLPRPHPFRDISGNSQPLSLVMRCNRSCQSVRIAVNDYVKSSGAEVVWSQSANEIYSAALAPAKLRAVVAVSYSVFAMVLAVFAIHSLMRFTAVARSREIAIRIAVGATATQILLFVMGYTLRVCGLGVVMGVCVGTALFQLARSLLFGVSAGDIWANLVGVTVLLLGAFAASIGTARRLAQTDPRPLLNV